MSDTLEQLYDVRAGLNVLARDVQARAHRSFRAWFVILPDIPSPWDPEEIGWERANTEPFIR